MTDKRAPLSIEQQAHLIDGLISRCVMRDGSIAGEAMLRISKEDADDLSALALRLHRIAPFEDRIRKMVAAR